MQLQIHFKLLSHVIKVVHDPTFVQLHVSLGLLNVSLGLLSPVILIVHNPTFMQLHVHFRHLPLCSRWFMMPCSCSYMSISNSVLKMVHNPTFMQLHVLFKLCAQDGS